MCLHVCVTVLDFSVSLPCSASPPEKDTTSDPVLPSPEVPAIFWVGHTVCMWECPAVSAAWPAFVHTLVYFVSTWGLSPTHSGVGDGGGCSLNK